MLITKPQAVVRRAKLIPLLIASGDAETSEPIPPKLAAIPTTVPSIPTRGATLAIKSNIPNRADIKSTCSVAVCAK